MHYDAITRKLSLTFWILDMKNEENSSAKRWGQSWSGNLEVFLLWRISFNYTKQILCIIFTVQDFVVEVVTFCFIQLVVIAVSSILELFIVNKRSTDVPLAFCLPASTFCVKQKVREPRLSRTKNNSLSSNGSMFIQKICERIIIPFCRATHIRRGSNIWCYDVLLEILDVDRSKFPHFIVCLIGFEYSKLHAMRLWSDIWSKTFSGCYLNILVRHLSA